MNQPTYAHLEAARLAGATIVASPDMHNWHIVGDPNKRPQYSCRPDKYAVLCDPSMFLAAQPPKADEKRCVMCGFTGQEDPVIGCPRCKWDEMQPMETAATPTAAADSEDAERYRWLRDSQACSLTINHNDHHCMYQSVADTLDDSQGYYAGVDGAERQAMIASDTIWTLHVYPNTPVGFNVWHGASLDYVIDAARNQEAGDGA